MTVLQSRCPHSNNMHWPSQSSLHTLLRDLCSFKSISTYTNNPAKAWRSSSLWWNIQRTVTFLVVKPRVGATWRNTAFFSGELLCQGDVNAAERFSPGPKTSSKERSEMWKRINNHCSNWGLFKHGKCHWLLATLLGVILSKRAPPQG